MCAGLTRLPSSRLLTCERIDVKHHADNDVGVAVTDRYTHHLLTFLETINKTSTVTMQNLVSLAGPLDPREEPRSRTAL